MLVFDQVRCNGGCIALPDLHYDGQTRKPLIALFVQLPGNTQSSIAPTVWGVLRAAWALGDADMVQDSIGTNRRFNIVVAWIFPNARIIFIALDVRDGQVGDAAVDHIRWGHRAHSIERRRRAKQ